MQQWPHTRQAYQQFYFCLRIRCRWNDFTELLPSDRMRNTQTHSKVISYPKLYFFRSKEFRLKHVPVQSRNVQLCTLLQVPMRLYGDSKSVIRSTATCNTFLYRYEDSCEIFQLLQLPFPKAHLLNVTLNVTLNNCVNRDARAGCEQRCTCRVVYRIPPRNRSQPFWGSRLTIRRPCRVWCE
jgi:hypothetical protein